MAASAPPQSSQHPPHPNHQHPPAPPLVPSSHSAVAYHAQHIMNASSGSYYYGSYGVHGTASAGGAAVPGAPGPGGVAHHNVGGGAGGGPHQHHAPGGGPGGVAAHHVPGGMGAGGHHPAQHHVGGHHHPPSGTGGSQHHGGTGPGGGASHLHYGGGGQHAGFGGAGPYGAMHHPAAEHGRGHPGGPRGHPGGVPHAGAAGVTPAGAHHAGMAPYAGGHHAGPAHHPAGGPGGTHGGHHPAHAVMHHPGVGAVGGAGAAHHIYHMHQHPGAAAPHPGAHHPHAPSAAGGVGPGGPGHHLQHPGPYHAPAVHAGHHAGGGHPGHHGGSSAGHLVPGPQPGAHLAHFGAPQQHVAHATNGQMGVYQQHPFGALYPQSNRELAVIHPNVDVTFADVVDADVDVDMLSEADENEIAGVLAARTGTSTVKRAGTNVSSSTAGDPSAAGASAVGSTSSAASKDAAAADGGAEAPSATVDGTPEIAGKENQAPASVIDARADGHAPVAESTGACDKANLASSASTTSCSGEKMMEVEGDAISEADKDAARVKAKELKAKRLARACPMLKVDLNVELPLCELVDAIIVSRLRAPAPPVEIVPAPTTTYPLSRALSLGDHGGSLVPAGVPGPLAHQQQALALGDQTGGPHADAQTGARGGAPALDLIDPTTLRPHSGLSLPRGQADPRSGAATPANVDHGRNAISLPFAQGMGEPDELNMAGSVGNTPAASLHGAAGDTDANLPGTAAVAASSTASGAAEAGGSGVSTGGVMLTSTASAAQADRSSGEPPAAHQGTSTSTAGASASTGSDQPKNAGQTSKQGRAEGAGTAAAVAVPKPAVAVPETLLAVTKKAPPTARTSSSTSSSSSSRSSRRPSKLVPFFEKAFHTEPILAMACSSDLSGPYGEPVPINPDENASDVFLVVGGKGGLLCMVRVQNALVEGGETESGESAKMQVMEDEVVYFTGHERTITKVQFTRQFPVFAATAQNSDGVAPHGFNELRLISVATDRQIRIWCCKTGACLRTHWDPGMMLGTAILLPASYTLPGSSGVRPEEGDAEEHSTFLMYASSNQQLKVVDSVTATSQNTLPCVETVPCDYETWCLSSDARNALVAGTKNGCLRVLNFRYEKQRVAVTNTFRFAMCGGRGAPVTWMTFVPASDTFIVSLANGVVNVVECVYASALKAEMREMLVRKSVRTEIPTRPVPLKNCFVPLVRSASELMPSAVASDEKAENKETGKTLPPTKDAISSFLHTEGGTAPAATDAQEQARAAVASKDKEDFPDSSGASASPTASGPPQTAAEQDAAAAADPAKPAKKKVLCYNPSQISSVRDDVQDPAGSKDAQLLAAADEPSCDVVVLEDNPKQNSERIAPPRAKVATTASVESSTSPGRGCASSSSSRATKQPPETVIGYAVSGSCGKDVYVIEVFANAESSARRETETAWCESSGGRGAAAEKPDEAAGSSTQSQGVAASIKSSGPASTSTSVTTGTNVVGSRLAEYRLVSERQRTVSVVTAAADRFLAAADFDGKVIIWKREEIASDDEMSMSSS